MAEPWIKVRVSLVSSDKVARLPNSAARWGWVKALLEAKVQRRPGVFAGRRHLADLLGAEGRYVPDYVRVGLAHDVPAKDDGWPSDCTGERCKVAYRDLASAGDLVIHDFRREQRDPTATDRKNDQRHGDVTLLSRESHGDVTPHSRALSPSLSMSTSPETVDEPYQVSGEPDDRIRFWLARTHHIAIREGNGHHQRIIGWLRQGATVEDIKAAIDAAVKAGCKGDRAVLFHADELLFPVVPVARQTAAEREAAEREAILDQYGRRPS